MVGGGQTDTLGPGYKVEPSGCRDGIGGAAATHIVARLCWSLGPPDLGSDGSGSGGLGRTYTRRIGQVGDFGEEFLAEFDRRPQTCVVLVVCVEGGCSLWMGGC